MKTPSRERKSISFDVFQVDLVTRELIKRDRRVRLQELPFRLLVALIERPGETVMREELRSQLWGEATVEFDDGLHTAVRKLREVLGDSATHPKFVETVPRRGYRFIAPVSVLIEPADATESTSAPDSVPLDIGRRDPVQVVDPGGTPGLDIQTAGFVGSNRPERRLQKIHVSLFALLLSGILVLAAVLVTVFLARRPAKKEYRSFADAQEAVPIAAEQGIERSPALSPDGTHLVFSWSGESGESPNLYVQNLDGTGRVRLTTDQAPDRSPAWSPDGRTIAFIRAGEVFSIPAIGGPQRRITTAMGDGLSWSADSRELAVSDREVMDGSLSVYLVSAETGKRRRLTSPAVAKSQDIWPAFTSRGDYVAFVRRTTTTDDIYKVSTAGGKPTRMAIAGRPLHGLAWTPDGGFLLAATGRQAPGLLFIPAGAHDQARMERLDIAGPDVYAPSVAARNGGPAMNLAFGHEISNWDILGTPLRGSHVAVASLVASVRNDQAPSFSPDGKWLAFNSARSGYEEIWFSKADGSEPRQLTHFNSGLASSPRWSPDGQRIVFDGTIESNRDIYVIRSDGGGPERMTREPSSEGQPSWSHDGRWIYFMSDRSGTQQIWKMPAGGGTAIQLTRSGGYQALEGSDCETLYYAKLRGGAGLWRVPVNGGPETLVSDDVWQNLWSIGDDGVYYFDIKGLTPRVFEVALSVPVKRLDLAEGTTATVATILTDLPSGVPALEVRSDGKYLAWVSRRQHTSEIMLIRGLHLLAQ